MDRAKIARELVVMARELVSDKRGDIRSVNNQLAEIVRVKLSHVSGIFDASVIPARSANTFTVILELEVVEQRFDILSSGLAFIKEFDLSLRQVKGIVSRSLKALSFNSEVGGRRMVVRPEIDGQVYLPELVKARGDYGSTHEGYMSNEASFDVVMVWK